MQTVIAGLHASAPQALSFAPSTHVRAFLLRRRQGNLLVYSAAAVADDAPAIEELGGVSRHYVNHWHEAAFGGADRVAATLEIPLFCHESERPSMPESVTVGGTFSARHVDGDDFEVIPIPGHTSGATAYLWRSGQHRCLFTGDTVWLREGEWVAAVLEFERSQRLHREPGADQGPGFRRARALGGDRRAALPRCYRPSGYPAPHRRDPRARAPRRRSLRTFLSRTIQGCGLEPGMLARGERRLLRSERAGRTQCHRLTLVHARPQAPAPLIDGRALPAFRRDRFAQLEDQ